MPQRISTKKVPRIDPIKDKKYKRENVDIG
jgi:hypothetical protein